MVDLANRVIQVIGEISKKTKSEKNDGADNRSESAGLAEAIYKQEGAKLQVVANRSLFIENSIISIKSL